jgi:tetratricopeptide (TPR) repeat protein
MKKVKNAIFALLITACLTSAAFAEDALLMKGIKSYKEGDYLGTVQTMELVVKESPKALAYYYMAMAYVQLGKLPEATSAYDKVIFLDPNSQLASYAEMGKQRLQPPKEEKSIIDGDLLKGIQNSLYSDKVEKDTKKRQLDLIKDKVNSGQSINPKDYKDLDDFTPKYMNKTPTPEQVAEAYKVLSQAGINPYGNAGMNAAMNPELLQLSMLTGGMGGGYGMNNSMNMLPMLMMMQQGGGNNINPQVLQTMMSNMLMPDMMNMYGSGNDKY